MKSNLFTGISTARLTAGWWSMAIVLLCGAGVYADEPTSGTNVPCSGYISPSNRSHGYDPAPNSVYVGLQCAWTAINTNSWITITSPTNGTGPGTLNYIVAVNTDPEPRSGNITIGGHILSMTQAGQDPVFDLQPLDQNVFAGETVTFNVSVRGTPPITYQWRYASRFNYVPLIDGNGIQGASSSNLVLTDVRMSQVGVYRVWVTTAGGANDSYPARLNVSCGFNLSASNASFGSLSATGSVTLNTVAPHCSWSIVNTIPWVAILSSITNTGNGTVVYAVAANPTTTARSASIRIADQTFTITQAAGAVTTPAISLAEALDTEGILEWSTIGAPAWFGQTLLSRDGVDAAQSGDISHNAAVTAMSIINGPGTLSFWWKVSSEADKDFLKFFVNGMQQTRISGEVDWQFLSYTFPSGTYTSKWTYSKSDFVSGGQDRGWVDQVGFLAGAGCIATLSHTNATHSSAPETGQVSLTVPEGCRPNVFTLSPWIAPVLDSEGGLVRYTLATNSLPWSRTGLVIISGQPFTVVQQGAPHSCVYSISPTNRTFYDFISATGVVSVTALDGCEWRVVNTNSWIAILSSLSNWDTGMVVYRLAPNTNLQTRTGYVMIGGQQFLVLQSGATWLQFVSRTETNATVSVQREEGRMYVVESSEDFIHWIPIRTNAAPSTVTDVTAGNAPKRFYRTVEVP